MERRYFMTSLSLYLYSENRRGQISDIVYELGFKYTPDKAVL